MIYIIKSHYHEGESSFSSITGVCNSQKDAFDNALKIAIDRLEDYDYNPKNRYYTCTRYSLAENKDIVYHNDNWETSTECNEYTIEEWELDNEKGKRLKIWYVNIDKAIKTFIIENKIKTNIVYNFIKSLENKLDTIDFCIEEKKSNFGLQWSKRKEPNYDVIKKWNEFYDVKFDKNLGC